MVRCACDHNCYQRPEGMSDPKSEQSFYSMLAKHTSLYFQVGLTHVVVFPGSPNLRRQLKLVQSKYSSIMKQVHHVPICTQCRRNEAHKMNYVVSICHPNGSVEEKFVAMLSKSKSLATCKAQLYPEHVCGQSQQALPVVASCHHREHELVDAGHVCVPHDQRVGAR